MHAKTRHPLFPALSFDSVTAVVVIDDASGTTLAEVGPDVSRRALTEIARAEGLDRVRIVPRDTHGERVDVSGYDVRVPSLPASPSVKLYTPVREPAPAQVNGDSRRAIDATSEAMQLAVSVQQQAAASQMASFQDAQERAASLTVQTYELRLADEKARAQSLELQLERLRGAHESEVSRIRDEHDDRLERELARARQAAEWQERQLRQQLEDTERRYKNRIDDIENDDRRGEARIVSELTAQSERLQDRVASLSTELDSTRDKLRAIEGRHEEELRAQRAKYADLDARYKRLRSDQTAEQQNIIEMLDRMAQTDDQEARQMMMHLFAAQHGIPMPEVDPMNGATAEMFKMATSLAQEFLAGAQAKRNAVPARTRRPDRVAQPAATAELETSDL
jgi:hypothetical protein